MCVCVHAHGCWEHGRDAGRRSRRSRGSRRECTRGSCLRPPSGERNARWSGRAEPPAPHNTPQPPPLPRHPPRSSRRPPPTVTGGQGRLIGMRQEARRTPGGTCRRYWPRWPKRTRWRRRTAACRLQMRVKAGEGPVAAARVQHRRALPCARSRVCPQLRSLLQRRWARAVPLVLLLDCLAGLLVLGLSLLERWVPGTGACWGGLWIWLPRAVSVGRDRDRDRERLLMRVPWLRACACLTTKSRPSCSPSLTRCRCLRSPFLLSLSPPPPHPLSLAHAHLLTLHKCARVRTRARHAS